MNIEDPEGLTGTTAFVSLDQIRQRNRDISENLFSKWGWTNTWVHSIASNTALLIIHYELYPKFRSKMV